MFKNKEILIKPTLLITVLALIWIYGSFENYVMDLFIIMFYPIVGAIIIWFINNLIRKPLKSLNIIFGALHSISFIIVFCYLALDLYYLYLFVVWPLYFSPDYPIGIYILPVLHIVIIILLTIAMFGKVRK